ncbi:MAG: GntR family transcriptional regulator [Deltaproteobacteria bacterium]|nr:GntR family transcriptional regulator [Deltaproteobacteria bacterium]
MPKLGASHKNLDTMVYKELKFRILERKLFPGDKIYQDRLALELGVSRTPLVNALKYLVHEKLIEAVPRRGYFVRQFTKEEMTSIFELREVLEGLAARRASTLITDAQAKRLEGFFGNFNELKDLSDYRAYAKEDRLFHTFVVEVGSKEFLRSILESYNVIAFSYQIGDAEGLVRPPSETIREHQAIIKAIGHRNPDKAEELMRMHLRKSRDRLRQDFREKDVPK